MPPYDDRHHPDLPASVRTALNSLARVIDHALPNNWGFSLLIFSFGEPQLMSYVANAERESMLDAMAEFLRHNGRTTLEPRRSDAPIDRPRD